MAQTKYGHTDSEGNFHPAWQQTDEELKAIFDSTPGGIDAKLSAVAAAGPGYVGATQWAQSMGMDVSGTGVGVAAQQAMNDTGGIGGTLGKYVGPLIKPAIAAGGAILGGMAAAPYLGLGGAAAAEGAAGAAGAGGTAAGGTLMPAAVAESAAGLSQMGLTQVAPGVWSAAGGAGAAGLSGLGTAGAATEAAGAGSTVAEAGALGSAGGTSSVVPTFGGVSGAAAAGGLPAFLSNPAVLGAAGGALLGSGVLGGGTQAGTIQVEEGIPDWLMPYVKPQLDQYSTQLQNYQTDPYGIMPSAMKEFQNTISGMYLDPSTNKYLEDYFRMGSERVKSSLSPTFGHMQAFGAHSGYNEALSKGLGDFATGLYGGAYEKERDRQAQFTAGAPQFLAQNTAQQFAPYQNYLSTVGQLGKKKQEPYFENPMGNLFGGAMAGAGLGSLWK